MKRLRLILTTCAVDPNLETLGSESGKTPLHWLCLRYDRENEDHEEDKERSVICLELLLAAGADVNAQVLRRVRVGLGGGLQLRLLLS